MKIRTLFLVILLAFISAVSLKAEVLSQEYCRLYEVHICGSAQNLSTSSGNAILDFGPGNINFLEELDIVVDKYHTINGIQIIYKTPDGIRRKVFILQVKGWVLEQPPSTRAISKNVLIRVITPESLVGQ